MKLMPLTFFFYTHILVYLISFIEYAHNSLGIQYILTAKL